VQHAHLPVAGQLEEQEVAGHEVRQLARGGELVAAVVTVRGHRGLLGWRAVHPSNAVARAAVTARMSGNC
jgi:hypothetical protein